MYDKNEVKHFLTGRKCAMMMQLNWDDSRLVFTYDTMGGNTMKHPGYKMTIRYDASLHYAKTREEFCATMKELEEWQSALDCGPDRNHYLRKSRDEKEVVYYLQLNEDAGKRVYLMYAPDRDDNNYFIADRVRNGMLEFPLSNGLVERMKTFLRVLIEKVELDWDSRQ